MLRPPHWLMRRRATKALFGRLGAIHGPTEVQTPLLARVLERLHAWKREAK